MEFPPISILCPKCKAAILAVSEASRLNFNYVLFEEDSQLTLKAINQEIHQDWEIVNIILDIRIMLNSFVAWYFSPSPRQFNSLAHNLAYCVASCNAWGLFPFHNII